MASGAALARRFCTPALGHMLSHWTRTLAQILLYGRTRRTGGLTPRRSPSFCITEDTSTDEFKWVQLVSQQHFQAASGNVKG